MNDHFPCWPLAVTHKKVRKNKNLLIITSDHAAFFSLHIPSQEGERGSCLVWRLPCHALTFPRWHFSLFDSAFACAASDWGLVLSLPERLRIFSVLNVISPLTCDAGTIAGRGRCTRLTSSAPTAPRCLPLRCISMQEDV